MMSWCHWVNQPWNPVLPDFFSCEIMSLFSCYWVCCGLQPKASLLVHSIKGDFLGDFLSPLILWGWKISFVKKKKNENLNSNENPSSRAYIKKNLKWTSVLEFTGASSQANSDGLTHKILLYWSYRHIYLLYTVFTLHLYPEHISDQYRLILCKKLSGALLYRFTFSYFTNLLKPGI